MTLTIRADWQLQPVQHLMRQLQEKQLKRVLASVVNTSAKQVETKAETIVAKETSIPKKRVKEGIFIRNKATEKFLETAILGSDVPIPLGLMTARETPTGTRLKMWDKRVHFPHGFMKGGKFPDRKKLEIRKGVPHVFERQKNHNRYFRHHSGIVVSESIGKKKNLDNLVILAHERIKANLKRLLQRAIDGKKYSKKIR